MHRTEGSGNINNLFTDGPPATCIEQNIMNALQEEICNVIERSGLTLLNAANDTKDQLWQAISLTIPGLNGYVDRPRFVYKDADEIYIDPGIYHHYGTTNQIVQWSDRLTFKFGPTGSNPDNDAFVANDFYYLYLDDSAIITNGSNIITVSELIAKVTEPVWNNSKHGWYDNLDRCICAFRTEILTAEIHPFHHNKDLFLFDEGWNDKTLIDIDTTWIDVTLTIPSFATMAQIRAHTIYVDGVTTYLKIRPNGSSVTNGFRINSVDATSTESINSLLVATDDDQIIEIVHSASNGCQSAIQTQGWQFPYGM